MAPPSFVRIGFSFAVLALTGCPARTVTSVDPDPSAEQIKDIPINLSRDIDILFVIDNSGSMMQEQASLAANFPKFIEVLEGITDSSGGASLPSVHIAVASSDVGSGKHANGACAPGGDDGRFRLGAGDGCSQLGTQPFIADAPAAGGARERNYSGTLEEAFSCVAALGIDGCGFEQHLESMRRALDDNPANQLAAFLRPDATLAVIFIADEDDCSATEAGADIVFDPAQNSLDDELGFYTSFRCWEHGVVCNDDDPSPRSMPADGTPSSRTDCVPRDDSEVMARVSDYVDFLKGLKADSRRVIVAGILGDPEPVKVQRADVDEDGDELEMELMASCSTDGIGDAAPATRLTSFIEAFGARGIRQTICPASGDLTDALTQIGELIAATVGNPCLEGDLIDRKPDTDGLQPECVVTDFQHKGSSQEISTVLPVCDGGDRRPCYQLIDGGEQCEATPTGLALEVLRDGDVPPETTVNVRCAVE